MLDYLRFALYGVLIIILFFIFQEWNNDHPKSHVATTPITTTENTANYIPHVTQSTALTNTTTGTTTQASSSVPMATSLIEITTDVVHVKIDPIGGNIVEVDLLNYPEKLHSKDPVVLLNNVPETRYIAQSGLLSTEGPDTSKGQAVFTTDQTQYHLNPDQNELQVKLHWTSPTGTLVTKQFTFKRNDYEINVDYQITNHTANVWKGNVYLQLMRKNTPPPSGQGFVSLATFFGAAISTPEKRFKKIPFKEMTKTNLDQTSQDGWLAMIQHYFISAWVPEKDYTSNYFTKVTPDGLYTIGLIGPEMAVSPNTTYTTHAKFYAGPSIADRLEKVAPGLQLTIDYGLLWFISAIIFWMMQKIYDFVGNWGWSIVIVTLIIKVMFYHLSAKSYRSMSVMKKLQPKINALKERYANDKQKLTQATIELYKKEKANPMSGCLPILIQVPVFIGLYWVLIESVQLRQAPFILWIHDLTSKDPYYILPVLMGLSMFLQQRLNPPQPDPVQAKVMLFMPIVFTLLFMNFPAGLMLYWFVNNMLSFLQQWFIMHRLEKAESRKTNGHGGR